MHITYAAKKNNFDKAIEKTSTYGGACRDYYSLPKVPFPRKNPSKSSHSCRLTKHLVIHYCRLELKKILEKLVRSLQYISQRSSPSVQKLEKYQ